MLIKTRFQDTHPIKHCNIYMLLLVRRILVFLFQSLKSLFSVIKKKNPCVWPNKQPHLINSCFNGTCIFIQLIFCSEHAVSASFGAVACLCVCEGSQPTSSGGSFISGVAVSRKRSTRASQSTLLSHSYL